MSVLDLDLLLQACSAGGPTCLTSVTELTPAGGPQSAVAPAKFAAARGTTGAYAYERRYLEGEPAQAVIIDSKQSQLNRIEQALQMAITDGHPSLSRMPRVEVGYERDGIREVYSDLTLPHRVFDGHVRAGTVDGTPVPRLEFYRAIRNSTPANARAIFDASPISLVFGSWDSSRSSRQGRWRSALVGEIVGFCDDDQPGQKGGARTDPVGMKVELTEDAMRQLAQQQRGELSKAMYDKVIKEASKAGKDKRVSASMLGLGGIPPTLVALAGVACHRIIRSHVLSFSALRQIRFGAGLDGDAACRALLAALALNGLARSDAELVLRANCDLREAAPSVVQVDQRGGTESTLAALRVDQADELLLQALSRAQAAADVEWSGVVLQVTGNPAIVAGAGDEDQDGGAA